MVASVGSDIAATPDFQDSNCNDIRPSGTILYLPGTGQPGDPSNVVEAIDPSGNVLADEAVPDAVNIMDVGSPNRALLVTKSTENFVVDSALASVTKLSFPGDGLKPIELRTLRPQSSKRWRLNDDYDQNTIELVDLETGNVVDLKSWLPAGRLSPGGAAISASGDYIAIEPFDRDQGLLIGPTNDPTKLRNFGRGSSIELSFSPDDEWVAFGRSGPNGRDELIVSEADNPDSQIVISDDLVSFPVMVSNPDRVIFVESAAGNQIALKVYDSASKSTRTVFDGGGSLGLLTVRTDGKFAIMEVNFEPGAGDSYMVIVNLMSGVHSTIKAHSNAHPYYPLPPDGELYRTTARWIPLITLESAEAGPSTTLPQYVMDFETGTLSDLNLDADWWKANDHAASVDGRYWAYGVADQGTQSRIAILDLVSSTTRTIMAGEPSGIDFSPDDCWIVSAVYEDSPAGKHPIIYITPTSGGPLTKKAGGRQPVWLAT